MYPFSHKNFNLFTYLFISVWTDGFWFYSWMFKLSQMWSAEVHAKWLCVRLIPFSPWAFFHFLAQKGVLDSYCTFPAQSGISQFSKKPWVSYGWKSAVSHFKEYLGSEATLPKVTPLGSPTEVDVRVCVRVCLLENPNRNWSQVSH